MQMTSSSKILKYAIPLRCWGKPSKNDFCYGIEERKYIIKDNDFDLRPKKITLERNLAVDGENFLNKSKIISLSRFGKYVDDNKG
jgi:hypothetical protein